MLTSNFKDKILVELDLFRIPTLSFGGRLFNLKVRNVGGRLKRKPFRVQTGRYRDFRGVGRLSRNYNRPFWLPATSYYFLSVAIAITVFFVVWGFLDSGRITESPWILSVILSGFVLVLAVLLREIVLKNARRRYLLAKNQLDRNVGGQRNSSGSTSKRSKLTIEKNTLILKNIEKKSTAANILKELPDAHLEVFELCEEYLALTKRELDNIGIGSPRFGSIRRGRRRVKELHRFHLLAWAAVESQIYTKAAGNCNMISEKLETGERALTVLDTALEFYPNESQLVESASLVRGFMATTKISHSIEQAEHAALGNDTSAAIGFYKDALFSLTRGSFKNEEKDAIAEKINAEINKLRDGPKKQGFQMDGS